MAENKKSFLLYCDLIHTVEELTDDEAGRLFKHTLRYVNDLHPEAPDRITKISFEPIRQSLKRDLIKYEAIREKKRLAGIASAESKKQNQHMSTHVESVQEKSTQSTVNDNVSVNVNVNDKENKRDAAKAATLKRISDFKESLYPYTKSKGGLYDNDMVKKFFDYWSETNKSETKMRWELEKTFEVSKRLIKWKSNEDKFISNVKTEKQNDHVY